MSKSAEAFRTISEVADALDTPAHVLRFWESRFAQIKPVKRAGGRRYYRPADVALLGGIKRLLHEDGLTIRGVQKLLREQGVRHVAGLAGHGHEGEPAAGPAPDAPAVNAAALNASAPAAPLDIAADLVDEAAPELPEDAVTDLFPTSPITRGGGPLPDRAPGVLARADLQRDREAAQALTGQAERSPHPGDAPSEGVILPAAALLRAMTAYHAAQRQTELTEIYQRLQVLHARRAADGQRSRP